MTTTTDINPMENGVQQAYIEVREALELILGDLMEADESFVFDGGQLRGVLNGLDDAISNNWDDLMAAFWRGVKQDIDLMEGN